MKSRIAPTPSGFLHPGNMFSFMLTWLWCRANQGKLLLRIDDADAERKRPEYVEDIFRMLEFVGIDWDEGPSGPGDFEKNWSQQCRTDAYESLAKKLVEKNVFYACRCSRSNRVVLAQSGECACFEQQIPLDEKGVSWRVAGGAPIRFHEYPHKRIDATIEGFVARKRDGMIAYQLSSLADDRHFHVTHIVRGIDLLDSTARQVWLDEQLDDTVFSQVIFRHHPLLTLSNGEKMSKSAGHNGESLLRTITKKQLLVQFADWMGWKERSFEKLQDMLEQPGFA